MSSNPSAEESQEPQVAPSSKGKKYLIHIEANGSVKGTNEAKWSSTCGKLIRTHIPMGYDDWRHVDEVYIDALWASLVEEFDFNIEPSLARPMLEPRFPQFFRTEKYHLRHRIKDKQGIYLPRHIAQSQCPDDIDKIWWEKFINNEYTPKKIEQRKKNAESKALAKITHTLGRKSYSRVYEELKEENPGEPATRTTAWKRAHVNKATGEVLPCAMEKYKEVEAAKKRQRLATNASSLDGVTGIEDFENDPIAEIFGADTNSHCRAISSTSSAKQAKIGLAAKAIASQNSNSTIFQRMEKLENLMVDMYSFVKSSHKPQNSVFPCGTPRTESDTNNVHIAVTPQNLRPVFDNRHDVPINIDRPTLGEKQYVVLLGRAREDAANGYIGYQSTCHGREVQDDEKVVWVTEVIKPEAPIYDGPQNGNSHLCELADGGFVIWATKRIRYL